MTNIAAHHDLASQVHAAPPPDVVASTNRNNNNIDNNNTSTNIISTAVENVGNTNVVAAQTTMHDVVIANGEEEASPPTYAPSKELTVEDVYNPHNLTLEELENFLYEWEEEAAPYVTEYFDANTVHKLRTGEESTDDTTDSEEVGEGKDVASSESGGNSWVHRLKSKMTFDDGSKTQVEFKKGPTKYLNLTDDAAHVVEFYAPWCPHCQHYKWEYIEVASEVLRRSISPVQFHAVSCDVHYAICGTYNVHGFPTILGWKQGESKANRGIEMNEEYNIEADSVGEMLGLDLAHEAVELYDMEVDDDETIAKNAKKWMEQGRKAAKLKKSWHEHTPHTHNDRYHDAALSLAFAVKSQLFQTVGDDGKMDQKRKKALIDFLNLLDWATPQSWNMRVGLIKKLQWKVDADALMDRRDVESLIDEDMSQHRSLGAEEVWGFVYGGQSGWTGQLFGRKQEELAKDDKHWTKACTHSQPAKGFTCGLWNLFHILTIGSSKLEHELYGFHRGYFVSPHHVAETIRNFVAYFFSCDVCRTNFLKMYDNCGHDHCNRLKSEITMSQADGSDSSSELALWLWEVHNSVNARLMTEAAQRQNREVSHEELLASKFPTKKMCPNCWLDKNMTKWDNRSVFHFLEEWFWPNDELSDLQFKSVIAGEIDGTLLVEENMDASLSKKEHALRAPTFQQSGHLRRFTLVFSLLGFSIILIVTVQRKLRDRRKKFVDSRYVKKKQSCLRC